MNGIVDRYLTDKGNLAFCNFLAFGATEGLIIVNSGQESVQAQISPICDQICIFDLAG